MVPEPSHLCCQPALVVFLLAVGQEGAMASVLRKTEKETGKQDKEIGKQDLQNAN